MSSDASEPFPPSHEPQRPRYVPPPPPPRGSGVLGCLFGLSMVFNGIAVIVIIVGCLGFAASLGTGDITSGISIHEHLHSGKDSATDKIAIIHLDGVILEGALDFVHKQIERAATDKNVKAVVLRINSPGGSITASDDLYRRFVELRDGNTDKKQSPKLLAVSMGALAASGGYYVAMPGRPIVAERTTMTGSVGVYASFPNITKLSDKWGFAMHTIKQGKIKDSGSPFKEMSVEEEQVWQDLVDTAYQQFLQVVETGRPKLKGKMLEPITMQPVAAGPPAKDKQKPGPYERYRADGGIFTADKALEFGFIDKLGYLDDVIREIKTEAGLGDDYKAVDYEKPKSLIGLLTAKSSGGLVTPGRLPNGLIPRLWFLAPGCELSGILSAAEGE